jgi:hypothetical protein
MQVSRVLRAEALADLADLPYPVRSRIIKATRRKPLLHWQGWANLIAVAVAAAVTPWLQRAAPTSRDRAVRWQVRQDHDRVACARPSSWPASTRCSLFCAPPAAALPTWIPTSRGALDFLSLTCATTPSVAASSVPPRPAGPPRPVSRARARCAPVPRDNPRSDDTRPPRPRSSRRPRSDRAV